MAFYANIPSAMRAAQLAYDNQLPDDTPTVDDWLETDEGANWVYDSSRQLIAGMDLKISGRTVLCCSALHDAVHERLMERIEQDTENLLPQIIIGNMLGQPEKHLATLLAGGENAIHEIAETLVTPFAKLRIQELRDEANEPQDE